MTASRAVRLGRVAGNSRTARGMARTPAQTPQRSEGSHAEQPDPAECHASSQDVTRCHTMSRDVTPCHAMSRDVTESHLENKNKIESKNNSTAYADARAHERANEIDHSRPVKVQRNNVRGACGSRHPPPDKPPHGLFPTRLARGFPTG